MLLKLSIIEMKYHLKSITFYVFVLLTIIFVFNQMGSLENWAIHPNANQKSKLLMNEMPEIVTNAIDEEVQTQMGVYELLSRAVGTKKMIVPGFFINREQKLTDEQVNLIKEAMLKISPGGKEIEVKSDLVLTSEEFEKVIDDLDYKLGGNTIFTKERREAWMPPTPITYEEYAEKKERIVNLGFTPIVAQLFADYYGLSLAILTVFLSAFIFYRDKRSHILELVCSRPIGGTTYVFSKFIGTCLPIFASIIAVACIPTFYAFKMKLEGFDVSIYAFFSTFAIWLFPGVMLVVAVSMMVSLLSNNPITAIVTQFVIIFLSISPLHGDYSLYKVFIRHNVVEPVVNPQALYTNRIFIAVMSIVLTFITACIWQMKRRRIGERIN